MSGEGGLYARKVVDQVMTEVSSMCFQWKHHTGCSTWTCDFSWHIAQSATVDMATFGVQSEGEGPVAQDKGSSNDKVLACGGIAIT